MKFSIRDVVLVTVIVALASAWYFDRSRLVVEVEQQRERSKIIAEWMRMWNLTEQAQATSIRVPNSAAPATNSPIPMTP